MVRRCNAYLRFKKLTFDGDRMMKPAMRRDALKWLTEEYNQVFKFRANKPPADAQQSAAAAAAPAAATPPPPPTPTPPMMTPPLPE